MDTPDDDAVDAEGGVGCSAAVAVATVDRCGGSLMTLYESGAEDELFICGFPAVVLVEDRGNEGRGE